VSRSVSNSSAYTRKVTYGFSWPNILLTSSSVVVGFVDSLAACRNVLPAVPAQPAALLMSGDRIGVHRHQSTAG
jgi:hypothetical protein